MTGPLGLLAHRNDAVDAAFFALITARLLAFARFLEAKGAVATPTAWLYAQLDGVSAYSASVLAALLVFAATQEGCDWLKQLGTLVLGGVLQRLATMGLGSDKPMKLLALFDEAHAWNDVSRFGWLSSTTLQIPNSRPFLARAMAACQYLTGVATFWTGTALSMSTMVNFTTATGLAKDDLKSPYFFNFPMIENGNEACTYLGAFLTDDVVRALQATREFSFLVGRGRLLAAFVKTLYTDKTQTVDDAKDYLRAHLQSHLQRGPIAATSYYDHWLRALGLDDGTWLP